MSNLVSYEKGQPDLSGIELAVGELILRGGTQFADCPQNNVKSSLVHFSTALACLLGAAPAFVAASTVYTSMQKFLNFCYSWMIRTRRVTADAQNLM